MSFRTRVSTVGTASSLAGIDRSLPIPLLQKFGVPGTTCVRTQRGQVECDDLLPDDRILTEENGFSPIFDILRYDDINRDTAIGFMRAIDQDRLLPGVPESDLWPGQGFGFFKEEKGQGRERSFTQPSANIPASPLASTELVSICVIVFAKPRTMILKNCSVRCPSYLDVYRVLYKCPLAVV